MFAFSFLEVTTGGAVPLRPPARHFLKDRGSDQETIAGTPPCKGAESGGVVWDLPLEPNEQQAVKYF